MIRVLIVDDSLVVQKVLSRELARFDDIEVVGTAVDPYVARERIAELRPDVITLDIEMPRMDGLTFLEKLMQHFPMPVIVMSSLTQHGSATALRALALGAVEVVPKPKSQFSVPDVSERLVEAIRAAARCRVDRLLSRPSAPATTAAANTVLMTTGRVIAIGASTGGTRAIETVLRGFPANGPATIIVQHMPADFTGPFAHSLDNACSMKVSEARDGDRLVPGLALVAPGGRHCTVVRSGGDYLVRLTDGPPVQHHRPSVDVLFASLARWGGPNAAGVLLTGMGADGARGLSAMRNVGSHTIAQDEQTSVVYGMPRVAAELGAAIEILPLEEIAAAATQWGSQPLARLESNAAMLVSARR